ncbi:hypothetical protein D3C87_242130 [compost metagenome]
MQETMAGPERFLNYPTNRTAGFFDSSSVMEPFLRDLARAGIERDKVEVLVGEDGINTVDQDGTHHGLFAKWMRLSQRFFHTGEWELVELADVELKQGHCLVAVTTIEEDEKTKVVELMRKYGGHDIKYFNPWYVEHFPNMS